MQILALITQQVLLFTKFGFKCIGIKRIESNQWILPRRSNVSINKIII
jgi:hypothetical protein